MGSLQTPNCPFYVAINHSEVRVWTGNVHGDEDKWSLCNMQMYKTYSIETAAVQFYLLWRTSHIVQLCWVFQQSACRTKKNRMKFKYKVVNCERLAQYGVLTYLTWQELSYGKVIWETEEKSQLILPLLRNAQKWLENVAICQNVFYFCIHLKVWTFLDSEP